MIAVDRRSAQFQNPGPQRSIRRKVQISRSLFNPAGNNPAFQTELLLAAGILSRYNVYMKTIKPSIAAAELLLIFPATLFMGALVVRSLQPLQYEPAHTAQRIVDWYAARVHLGLWVLLIALPLTVLATGSMTLLRAWNENADFRRTARQALAGVRAHLAILFVAAATLAAGGILVIVALHMLSD